MAVLAFALLPGIDLCLFGRPKIGQKYIYIKYIKIIIQNLKFK
jgi:hypothetical protein